MNVLTDEHAEGFIGEEPNTRVSGSVETQTSLPTNPLNSCLPKRSPVIVESSPDTQKRIKRRPINKLHLGSLAQASITDNSTSQCENQPFNLFFSNIRQKLGLGHSSIKERFPLRFPNGMQYDSKTGSVKIDGNNHQLRYCAGMLNNHTLPLWLQRCLSPNTGQNLMAEYYEHIEKSEQKRLKGVIAHHSQVADNFMEHPFSIVAAMEKGTLNRYTNIWPFEYTRVKLRNKENDYINASYIQYSRHYPRYISTQGPLPATFNDFWALAWDENSRIIVMLTKEEEEEMNRIKCHRYWPTETENIKVFGSITINFVSETESLPRSTFKPQPGIDEGTTLRTFEMKKDGQEPRIIRHFHYRGWQDHGVPDDPVGTLHLVKLVQKSQKEFKQKQQQQNGDDGPIIVHCSAGCGRTGAFCTIDTLIQRLSNMEHLTEEEQTEEIDLIYQTVSKFREQRMSMVQTFRQFIFVYESILWWILDVDSS
ncbi:hypothetical protein HMPREF1544_02003 [Mucor circinelloides 1006PhL]|uniref:Protein-tyrosine phosphatase n=1 Tax=Mucor circinelloides f. circinelloides (strain 1006PhL) TaxID=1220926 RepID=S2K6S0_MUCC1|nr:hypothetical protein HMPREF1544_02003 [Mucor circinelloides 1006PhL]